ncbi:homodimeric glycerol 3-phosphate dehydrogenase (quinone) [Faunimonas pinastri]|uniref:Glycerol-3-phosphate dehydrogenase n=1 Tax=Faunimonas pinastri TaxID=1855383 RepID=A0A1H9AJE3_9HYPH|nr:glycerol-3-phosphate dehydrogenase [Faunimonas pinastri]SEP76779.1 homodimeric glycerol 3-phosphate dehydrogenase (quinone) [Faunimonas pinastri]
MAGGEFDILVIGGGINGTGIARDAAGRGYSVLLCEAQDLASGTSSASTKLVHGGLRYLEHYEFRLVREALREREVLWRMAPHVIWPLRFVLPHHAGLRPRWLLRLGLFLYDHLGGRKLLPPATSLDLRRDVAGGPLKPHFTRAFEYSDCWVDDSRLVVLNARSAAKHGATIRVRTRVSSLAPDGGGWRATLQNSCTGEISEVRARMAVNAAGPWVDTLLAGMGRAESTHNVRLVQGSHIVVRKLFDHDRCYIFQNADGRIVFAIPYEGDYTLIGTTDLDYPGDPSNVRITEGEVDYLRAAAGQYFNRDIEAGDVVWSYSGVRPLYNDGASIAQEATRDYVLRLDGPEGPDNAGPGPRILNVFGGKLTTYRKLAEAALTRIGTVLGPRGMPWTSEEPLPGGDFPIDGFEALVTGFEAAYPGFPVPFLRHLLRSYGTDAARILGSATGLSGLGRDFGGGLSEAEVRFLMEWEWARSAEDILWRRSKLGLRLDRQQVAELEAYLETLVLPRQMPTEASPTGVSPIGDAVPVGLPGQAPL